MKNNLKEKHYQHIPYAKFPTLKFISSKRT